MQESRKSKMKSRADNFCEDFLEFHSLPTQWNYRVIDLMPWLSNKRFTEAGESIFLRELKKEVAETLEESNMHPQHKLQFVNKLVEAFRNKYQQADVSSSLAARTKEVLTQAFNEHLNNLRDKPAEMKTCYKTQLQIKLPHYYHQFFNVTDKTTKQHAERKISSIFASTQYGIEQQLLAKEDFTQLVQAAKEKILSYLEEEIKVLNAKQTSPLSGEKINKLNQAEEAKRVLLQKVYAATKTRFANIEQTSTKTIATKNNETKQQTATLQERLFNNHLVSTVTSYSQQIINGTSSVVDSMFSNRVTKPLWEQMKRVGKYSYNLSTRSMKWVMDNPGKLYVFATLGMAVAARAFSSRQVNFVSSITTSPAIGATPNMSSSLVAYTQGTRLYFRFISNIGTPQGSEKFIDTYAAASGGRQLSVAYNPIRDTYFLSAGGAAENIWEVDTSGIVQNIINSTVVDPLCTDLAVANNGNIGYFVSNSTASYVQLYSQNGTDLRGIVPLSVNATASYNSCSISKRFLGGFHALQYNSQVEYRQLDDSDGSTLAYVNKIDQPSGPLTTEYPRVIVKDFGNNRSLAVFPSSTNDILMQVLDSTDGQVLDASGSNSYNQKKLNYYHTFRPESLGVAIIPDISNFASALITGISDIDRRVYGIIIKAINQSGNDYEYFSGSATQVEFLLSQDFTSSLPSPGRHGTAACCDNTTCNVVYNSAGDIKSVRFGFGGVFDYASPAPTPSPMFQPQTPASNTPSNTPIQSQQPSNRPVDDNKFPTGAVVGGGIAGLIVVVGGVAGCVVYNKRKHKGFNKIELENGANEDALTLKYKVGNTIFKGRRPLFHMILCWLSRPGCDNMSNEKVGDGKEIYKILRSIKRKLEENKISLTEDDMDQQKLAHVIAYGISNTPGVNHLGQNKKLDFLTLKDNIGSIVEVIREKLVKDGLFTQKQFKV